MKKEQPNILIFMTDQQRGDTVPPWGKAKLPAVEKLAREGVSFAQTFCPSPHCCPSRATFFSGLYPSQHGVWNNIENGTALSQGLYEGVRLWSEDLKEAGYDLHFSGKWHVSHVESPAERGWDVTRYSPVVQKKEIRYQHPSDKTWSVYQKTSVTSPGLTRKGYIDRPGYPPFFLYGECAIPRNDRQMVDDAIDFIRHRSSDEPWCQYVGVTGPHDAYLAPEEFLELYPLDEIELPENFHDMMRDKPGLYRKNRDRFDQLSEQQQREAIQHYLACCSYEDSLFGDVIKVLEEKNELDNTVVIYLSDHGDYAAEHGLWTKGLPCFRGAYHIPLVIRWPEGIRNPGRVVDEFVSLADIAPTLLEIAGVSSSRQFAGKSLLPFLRDEKVSDWRDAIYTQSNGNEIYGIQRSVTTCDWKFIYNSFDYDELYDLNNDPGETCNVAREEKYQNLIREMYHKIWTFAREHDDVWMGSYIFTGLTSFGPGIIFEG